MALSLFRPCLESVCCFLGASESLDGKVHDKVLIFACGRRTLHRLMSPDTPLEASTALAALIVSANDLADESPLPQRSVITLL